MCRDSSPLALEAARVGSFGGGAARGTTRVPLLGVDWLDDEAAAGASGCGWGGSVLALASVPVCSRLCPVLVGSRLRRRRKQ